MAYEVLTRDETTAGVSTAGPVLAFPVEEITVRELIRERVYQEVQDYNRKRAGGGAVGKFEGLVRPSDEETALNGERAARSREVDWKRQFEVALESYEGSRVLVLVGDRQTRGLDETITLTRGVEVTFLRLAPLVGG